MQLEAGLVAALAMSITVKKGEGMRWEKDVYQSRDARAPRRWGDVGVGGRPVASMVVGTWATVFFGLSCYLGESVGPTKIADTIFRAGGLMGSGRALSNDRIRPHCARSMARDLPRSGSKDRDDNSAYR